IKTHVGDKQRCGAMAWIEPQLFPADRGASLREFSRRGKSLSLARKTPKPNKRADGDIESAIGDFGDMLGFLKDVHEVAADRDRLAHGLLAQEVEFAIGAIIAHLLFEIGHALEGGLGGLVSAGTVGGVQGDREERAHLGALEREAVESQRRGGGSAATKCQKNEGREGKEQKREPFTGEPQPAF